MSSKLQSILHFLIGRLFILSLILCFQYALVNVSAQRLSRDLNVDLLINQIGYLPDVSKNLIVNGNIQRNFDVIDLETQKIVFTGKLLPNKCDFGEYSVGYFSLQRCGSSTTGYLSPCHLDDGIRMDNGKHQDVTGGWHDASDLRKWVEATIYGMIGLAKTWELHDNESRGKILEELLWGNEYFLKMQAQKQENPSGFFYTSSSNMEPYKDIYRGCFELISMCDLIQAFPSHKDVPAWKDMISKYAYDYLLFMSGKNSFGIIPYGLYTEKDPGGNRKTGDYWYRYFMEPVGWWTGINANLASAGVGLVKAADILKDKKLKALAQKQFDWILGVNPFNSSTMHGAGYNHPIHYSGNAFLPGTPVIPGAVMNGLGGDPADQPDIGDGNYHISEYWTPMVVYTLWFMAEMSKE